MTSAEKDAALAGIDAAFKARVGLLFTTLADAKAGRPSSNPVGNFNIGFGHAVEAWREATAAISAA